MGSVGPDGLRAPLTETEFFILLGISSGPKHGYAVMKAAAALSDGRVILGTGTLYGALKRMLGRGWIVRREEKGSSQKSGRIRKVYALTPLGKGVLGAEIRRLRNLVGAARQTRAWEES